MLSKDDYKNYLDQIKSFENAAKELYAECAGRLEDGPVRETCRELLKQEIEHIRLLEEL